MTKIKNVASRNVFNARIIAEHTMHTHRYNGKRVRVPVFQSDWVEKPGKGSWRVRRKK